MKEPVSMGIGGSLDCGAASRPPNGTVTEIWVPTGSDRHRLLRRVGDPRVPVTLADGRVCLKRSQPALGAHPEPRADD